MALEFFTIEGQALACLLRTPGTSDVLVQSAQGCWVDHGGELMAVDNPFSSEESVRSFLHRALEAEGKRFDLRYPFGEGRLPDGSRYHYIHAPLSPAGTLLTVRAAPQRQQFALTDFTCPRVARELETLVAARKNLLLCGATGSGKTTLLGTLLNTVPTNERVLILEETAEILPASDLQVTLLTRSAGPEGQGEITLRQLLKSALRMRPDRLVLGECRGPEAFDLIQALSTGHGGSLCTVHANSALAALKRLEALTVLAHPQLTAEQARTWIAEAIHAVVFLRRAGAKREISEIIRLYGLETGRYRHERLELS